MMSKRLIIIELLNILSEVIKETKEIQIDQQQIDHANKLFLETVKDHDDLETLFYQLLEMKKTDKLTKGAVKRILLHLGKLHRDQIAFDEACISILDYKNI